ncbi:hypothetical protein, unlikely [Trypanosoma congolense IL3000]|uniref:Uncharacterized protein n=1 Tax=Trypanosoma congolense (strain IL3000) TaxID=1068625 RepID=F9W480_TRYCI|nr:hypothetical protein, unlikely [Trypanosoma congolense IL3000]
MLWLVVPLKNKTMFSDILITDLGCDCVVWDYSDPIGVPQKSKNLLRIYWTIIFPQVDTYSMPFRSTKNSAFVCVLYLFSHIVYTKFNQLIMRFIIVEYVGGFLSARRTEI